MSEAQQAMAKSAVLNFVGYTWKYGSTSAFGPQRRGILGMGRTYRNESGADAGRRDGGNGIGVVHPADDVAVNAETQGVHHGNAGQRRRHAAVQTSELFREGNEKKKIA